MTSTSPRTESGIDSLRARIDEIVGLVRRAQAQGLNLCHELRGWDCFTSLLELPLSNTESRPGPRMDPAMVWRNYPLEHRLTFREELFVFAHSSRGLEQTVERFREQRFVTSLATVSEAELQALLPQLSGVEADLIELELMRRQNRLTEGHSLARRIDPATLSDRFNSSPVENRLNTGRSEIIKAIRNKETLTSADARLILEDITENAGTVHGSQSMLDRILRQFGLTPELQEFYFQENVLRELLRSVQNEPGRRIALLQTYRQAMLARVDQVSSKQIVGVLRAIVQGVPVNECVQECRAFILELETLATEWSRDSLSHLIDQIRFVRQIRQDPEELQFFDALLERLRTHHEACFGYRRFAPAAIPATPN